MLFLYLLAHFLFKLPAKQYITNLLLRTILQSVHAVTNWKLQSWPVLITQSVTKYLISEYIIKTPDTMYAINVNKWASLR